MQRAPRLKSSSVAIERQVGQRLVSQTVCVCVPAKCDRGGMHEAHHQACGVGMYFQETRGTCEADFTGIAAGNQFVAKTLRFEGVTRRSTEDKVYLV